MDPDSESQARGKRAFHLMAKPTGAVCNLDCAYCYFLSKDQLYPGSGFRMSDEVLEAYIRGLLEAHEAPEATIAWQGGEPTLMGLSFFEMAVRLAERYRKPGQSVLHTIQTNGTLLDDDWCEFFSRHGFLVGLSVDGPQEVHDACRRRKGGQGTFDAVMRGWSLLQKHRVETNVLCTVHRANEGRGLEVYRFFRDRMRASFVQFIPIVERTTPELIRLANEGWSERPGGARPLYRQAGSLVTDRSVTAEGYGRFLCDVYDEWVRKDVGTVFIQLFDATLGAHLGRHSLCIHAPECGQGLALEHNGDVYACDHYVEPDYLVGNLLDQPLSELAYSERMRTFGQNKRTTLTRQCRDCDVRRLCHGGCPKDRFVPSRDGEPGHNYLCAGLERFFRHSEPTMRHMAELVSKRLPADGVMGWLVQREGRARGAPKLCPCGSGKPFRKCCGRI